MQNRAVNGAAAHRRAVLSTGVAAMLTLAGTVVRAQRGLPKVAFLSGATEADSAQFYQAFVQGLRERGHRDGETLSLLPLYAGFSTARASQLALALQAERPALVVASGGGIAPAVGLSPELPVVFLHSGDPVVAGFADSLARPGRNATGISLLALDLIEKRLDLMRQLQPRLRRVGFLASPEHAGQQRELRASREAASKFDIEIIYREARTPEELAAALPSMAAAKPDAVLLFSDALMVGQRQLLAEHFLRHRIPSAAGWSAFVEAGHLLSYGPDRPAAWRRLAYFVDRILQGSKAAELPIELPTVIELALNRRTASSLGLGLPPPLLLRADRVVD